MVDPGAEEEYALATANCFVEIVYGCHVIPLALKSFQQAFNPGLVWSCKNRYYLTAGTSLAWRAFLLATSAGPRARLMLPRGALSGVECPVTSK